LLGELARVLAEAGARRQRRGLVLAGDREGSIRLAQQVCDDLALADSVWFSDTLSAPVPTVHGQAAFRLMGREIDTLIFDAWSGFDPDAFGALTGCIRAGGLLLLLTPPLADWPAFADPQHARITVAPYPPEQVTGRFLRRLVNLICHDPALLVYEQGRLVHLPAMADEVTPASDKMPAAGVCRTSDQQRAVEALIRVATGHRRRPVVLTSDRGRGKTAAFGIAAARLIDQGRRRIVLTAPRRDAVAAVFEHAERLSPGAGKQLRFVPPDELVQHPVDADLLLVDEAAAIPTPLLESLLKRHSRIAFATTVHGYEGTGRGFALRFSRLLDKHSNSWKGLELITPIRWALHDPLENLVFGMLALNAEPADSTVFEPFTRADEFELLKLDRNALVDDERTLSELFGLLVQAHYRTRPLDLRHLLDGPNLSVYTLRAGDHIAATALVAAEGGFDESTAHAIWAGTTRPHGHLLAETLAAHQGLEGAPLLRCGRIMRVTVHPALQRRGLGSRLVREISAQLEVAGYDYVGASFGATSELLEFWNGLGWRPVRLSIQKGASSGAHSAVYLQALSPSGRTLLAQARQRFYAQFPHQLSDSLRELDPQLLPPLLRQERESPALIDTDDRRDLLAFSHQQRLAEVTIGSLWRLGLGELMNGRAVRLLNTTELTTLIVRTVQKRSWAECVAATGLPGRKQALQTLRLAVKKLIA
jgi:tRNA(Met) cytidine acetyltransferase